MNKHTPGPWKHESIEDCWWVTAPSKDFGDEIVAVFGGGVINVQNARLIAAAPDLLTALKYARRNVNASECDLAFIDAAIAKATGETK
jgi:hypothetical protein